MKHSTHSNPVEKHSQNLTLVSFWHSVYLPWAESSLKESSLQVKIPIVRKFILPLLGQYKLSDITAETVDKWHKTLLETKKENGKPYASTYIRVIHNQLVAILEKAVKEGYLVTNVAASLGSIGDHDARKVSVWSPDKYMRFLLCIKDSTVRLICNLAFWCSLRRTEILSLTAEDVGRDSYEIMVTLPRPVNPGWSGSPVTLASPFETRIVDIPCFMRKELTEIARKVSSNNEPLFTVSVESLREIAKDAARRAGLMWIGFGGLRDSSIVLLIKAGFTPAAIAQHAGLSLQAFERRFSQFFVRTEGISEYLVQFVAGLEPDAQTSSVHQAHRIVGQKPVCEVSIFPSYETGKRQSLKTAFALDQITLARFATWCGLGETSRKALATAGITVLKAAKLDESELAEQYHIPERAITVLKEAFKALGVRSDITKADLHALGLFRYEDFSSFRERHAKDRERAFG